MADTDVSRLVATAFLALADVLEPQPMSAWDAPSLCEGWRVREVVAHVSNAARYTSSQYLAEVQADGGDFGATSDRLALRDAQLDPRVLLGNLRDEQLHRWVPPGGDRRGALTHVVIHGLDATMPLAREGWLDDEARLEVLGVLTAGGVHKAFGTAIDGILLEATDLPWRYGDGRVVSATSDALIVALAGRRLPPGRIDGTFPLARSGESDTR